MKANDDFEFSLIPYPPKRPKGSPELFEEQVGLGPTLIYVPTRIQTLMISDFFCGFGVRAAAYNAKVCLDIFFFLSVDKSLLYSQGVT